MKTIPFSTALRSEIESGRFIVVIPGRQELKCRVIDWNVPGDYPVAVLSWKEDDPNSSSIETYTADGYDGITTEAPTIALVDVNEEPGEFEYAMLRYLQEAASQKDDADILTVTRTHSEELKTIALRGGIAPYWSEERGGVVIPLLGIVLNAKNLLYDESWTDARTMCAAVSTRMFTKHEAYILMWQKDEINAILKEHDGDLLDGWYWTDTEDKKGLATNAWYVDFGSGYFSNGKHRTLTVRAVAAL